MRRRQGTGWALDARGFETVVEVTRGGRVESIHLGAAAVCDAGGARLAWIGDPDLPVWWRSTAKPFQAVPLLVSGAAERFAVSDAELALVCASHSGEPEHVAAVGGLLRRAGLVPEQLGCGAHAPYHAPSAAALLRRGESPTVLHNNCSGKHAGMLLQCLHLGSDPARYLEPDHPVQRAILANVARHAGVEPGGIEMAIDGCSAPTFALPLAALARAYAALAVALSGRGDADLGRIALSMAAHPANVGGTGRLDTVLMEAAPGRLIAKVGAEGIYAVAALAPTGPTGLALKIADGTAERARTALVLHLVERLALLPAAGVAAVRARWPAELHNCRGLTVGEIRVRGAALRQA